MTRRRKADGEDGGLQPLSSDIPTAIAVLEQTGREALVDRWRYMYRFDPPKGVGQRFLIGAIAQELQMRQAGRSAASVRRRMDRIARAQSSAVTMPATASQRLRPGARLIREWNGSTHTVDVANDGYVWNGVRYRSLSAVARAITGTRWSGPRFFGLTQDADR